MEYLSDEINNSPTMPQVRKIECSSYTVYVIVSELLSSFWDLFGPPQFHGSLLPRLSDLGGLGKSTIGIPNQNLNANDLLGHQSHSPIPTPGAIAR